ncbi:hypothetical protein EJ08DRAFT_725306 [Tothia fuscella]|uniref:Terpene synthase n=1 Tax=Tothia fuscella TaxID=1048955 RepID=A0A9P4NIF7_9PEZI|nr:hypothetical protein EJ08DRAFT_725306 [Tothia fuscella]
MEIPKVSFVMQKVQLTTCDLIAKLVVPHLESAYPTQGRRSSTCDNLEKHFQFRLSAEPTVSIEKVKRKATAERMAISATFPSITDSKLVLAMTAWLFHLCTVDDLVEQMSLTAGQRSLCNAIGVMRRRKHVSLDLTSKKHADISMHRRASSDQISDAVLASRVHHITETFRRHLRSLLSPAAYTIVSKDICEVLSAMSSETEYKHLRRHDLGEYLSIRQKTIGLAPFFTLLCRSHTSGPPSNTLSTLQTHIAILVGFQNDLVGLEKDHSCGEWMNYIIISTGRQHARNVVEGNGLVECGIKSAIMRHNEAARRFWSVGQRLGKREVK